MVMKSIALFFLAICSITDIRSKKISLGIAGLFAAAGIALTIAGIGLRPFDAIGGILIGACLLGLARITGERIGYGDGVMVGVTGLFLGLFSNFALLCLAAFFSGIYGIAMMIFKKANKDTELAMAPFLALALVVMML